MPNRDSKPFLVYISGNNGSGKTTFARAVAPRLGFSHLPEERFDTSYLQDLFFQPRRWSFEAQSPFLAFKVNLVQHATSIGADVVIERSPHEDVEIFARYVYETKRLDSRAFRTYHQLYRTLSANLREPDLFVYCRCSVASIKQRIANRRREYEQSYPPDHLERLEGLYSDWLARTVSRYPGRVVTVDTEKHDFENDEQAIEDASSDLAYFLAHDHVQLKLFEEEDIEPLSLFPKQPRFSGVLQMLNPNQLIRSRRTGRKLVVYFAAPFTSKAGVPSVWPRSDAVAKQSGFEDWALKSAAHGTIQDREYRSHLETIESIISDCGYKTFLPHRDVNRWGHRKLTPEQAAKECTDHVLTADVLVAMPEMSLGSHYEVGVALGSGVPVILLLSNENPTSLILNGLGAVPNVVILRFSGVSDLALRLPVVLKESIFSKIRGTLRKLHDFSLDKHLLQALRFNGWVGANLDGVEAVGIQRPRAGLGLR